MKMVCTLLLPLMVAASAAFAADPVAPARPATKPAADSLPAVKPAANAAKPAAPPANADPRSASGTVKTAQVGSQQNRMKECNKQATGKKGAERKAFMKSCLSTRKG